MRQNAVGVRIRSPPTYKSRQRENRYSPVGWDKRKRTPTLSRTRDASKRRWGSHTLTSNLPNATFAGVCVEFLRPVCLQHRVPHDPFVLPEK